MDCKRVRDRLGFYLDGEIDEGSLEQIEMHLEECEECRRELASLRLMIESAREIEPVTPPAGLKQEIYRAVQRSENKTKACERVIGLMSAFMDGELDPADHALVNDHIAVCELCADELRALQALVASASSIEHIEPPISLRERIAAATIAKPKAAPLIERLRMYISPMALRWAGGLAIAGIITASVVTGLRPTKEPSYRASVPVKEPVRITIPIAPTAPQPAHIAQTPAPEPSTPNALIHAEPERAAAYKPATKPTIVAAAPKLKMKPKIKPAKPGSVPAEAGNDDSTGNVTQPDDTTDVQATEVAAVPEPAPEIREEAPKADRAVLMKVVNSPAKKDETEEWLKQVKAQVAMRRAAKTSEEFSVVTAKF